MTAKYPLVLNGTSIEELQPGDTIAGITGYVTTSEVVVAAGKTLTVDNTLTLAGTDSKTLTIDSSLTLAGTDSKTLTIDSSLTLAGTDSKTLTVNNSLTLAGTDSTTMTFPASSTTVAGLGIAQTFTAPQRGTVTTDNDGSFDMNATNNFKCTPTGSFTLTFTNITAGQSGNIWLDNSSGYTVSAASAVYINADVLTAISTAGIYWLSYYSPDGTNVAVTASGALT